MSSFFRANVIAVASIAVLAFILYATGLFSLLNMLSLIAGSFFHVLVTVIVTQALLARGDEGELVKPVNDVLANVDSATLYVGNLPYRANEDAVKALFAQFGTVINVRLMKDRQTGRRRGFGFVEVASKDAAKMIQKLNDYEFQERTLKVREAKEKQEDDTSSD